MNKTTLKRLSDIFSRLEVIRDELDNIQSEAQDEHDGKSEKWQESEAGEASAERLNNLESAVGEIETAMESVSNAHGGL